MDDTVLADEVIARLNALIEDAEAKSFIEQLLAVEVPVSERFANEHPTIQCSTNAKGEPVARLLGLLNGICGVRESDGWGHVCGNFEDTGALTKFERTPPYTHRR